MSEPSGGQRFHVHCSGVIAQGLRQLQRQASQEGRGPELLSAFERVIEQLMDDPNTFGEPLYRLPSLRMQVRCGVILPLGITYGVSEDWPLVFIRGGKLLAKRK